VGGWFSSSPLSRPRRRGGALLGAGGLCATQQHPFLQLLTVVGRGRVGVVERVSASGCVIKHFKCLRPSWLLSQSGCGLTVEVGVVCLGQGQVSTGTMKTSTDAKRTQMLTPAAAAAIGATDEPEFPDNTCACWSACRCGRCTSMSASTASCRSAVHVHEPPPQCPR
jgi:hypothetical protein